MTDKTDLTVEPPRQACGARISGINLHDSLDQEAIKTLRRNWLDHQSLTFLDQDLGDDDTLALLLNQEQTREAYT